MQPTAMYDVDWTAAGKAVIDLIFHIPTAVTVAPQVAIGIIFGPSRANPVPYKFSDIARAQVTAATDTAVGTITLAESAQRITSIMGVIGQGNVITAGEELIGVFRLDSDDVNFAPAQYPFVASYSAGLGANIEAPSVPVLSPIPVNIPVKGGARIDSFVDLNTAVTNAAEVEIYVGYE
ncbi:MAG: hypothetical protein GF350_04095 [Chitinivibrionales bacterium]|nr:hypothetical protein [Chitinivibrionales bacterium]